jgi:uncharacterized coiled-coil protein SlyX
MKRAISIAGMILLAAALSLPALAVSKKGGGEPQKGGLPTLEDRVEKLEGEVALLNSEVAALQSAVAALQSAVSALQTAVAALQTAVSSLQHAVATLQTAVADLQGQNNWAVVSSTGTVVRHSGSTPLTAAKLGTGVYEVTFGKDVSGCAYVATIGDTAHAASGPGQISVSGDVDGGNPDDVQVATFDKTGTAADSSFHLYVSCP